MDCWYLNRNFIFLWSAQSLTVLSQASILLMLPILYVEYFNYSDSGVALLRSIEKAGYLLLLFVFGYVTSEVKKDFLLFIYLPVYILLIVISYNFESLNKLLLFFIVFFCGAFCASFKVSILAFMPTVVESRDLQRANARFEGVRSAVGIAAPILAGCLIPILPYFSFCILNIVLLTLSVILISCISNNSSKAIRVASSYAESLNDIKVKPFAVIQSNKSLIKLFLASISFLFFESFIVSQMVFYVLSVLSMSSLNLGSLLSLEGVGAFSSSLLFSFFVRSIGFCKLFLCQSFLISFSALLLTVSSFFYSNVAFFMLGMFIFFNGFGRSIFNIGFSSCLQYSVPKRLLPKVDTYIKLNQYISVVVGAFVGGILVSALSIKLLFLFAAAGLTVTTFWLSLTSVEAASLSLSSEKPLVKGVSIN